MRGVLKMSENKKNSFVAYEHKEIAVKRELEAIYTDGYPSFGWMPDGRGASTNGLTSVNLKFKRDRKITNREELTKFQREFENCVKEIERMENTKVIVPSIVAYVIGIIGTVCMAGATFAYLAGMITLCIVLSIPGFIGWIIPYFCYLRIKRSKTEQITPLIDQKYDTIYEVCEKATGLLHI